MEAVGAIADTGFIVALLNRTDDQHLESRAVYLQQQSILFPQTVLAEVAYLAGRESGNATVAAFLKGLSVSKLQLSPLVEADLLRVAEILEQYADSRIDFVDATVMAMAERFGLVKVLTLDQRDFRLFRPKHCQAFELLP